MKREGWNYTFYTLGKFIGIGWLFAFVIVAGIAGGVWLDKAAGTSPLFMILGLALGVAVIVLTMYKIFIQARDKDK